MSDASLSTASFIVLGLLAHFGPGTSYDLNRWAEKPIGYFWTFPRSQLYAEPQRLTALGLLTESREESGRRRRTYTITGAGRQALRQWLAAPAGTPELRDLGLLKLFFIAEAGDEAVQALASEQLGLHRARLAEYEEQERRHECAFTSDLSLRTLRMGLLYERASVAFWTEMLACLPEQP